MATDFQESRFDVGLYWENRRDHFPRLYVAAQMAMAASATAVASESMFSKTGVMYGDRRRRLTPATLSMLNFCYNCSTEADLEAVNVAQVKEQAREYRRQSAVYVARQKVAQRLEQERLEANLEDITALLEQARMQYQNLGASNPPSATIDLAGTSAAPTQ